jgi:hypothetical protein
MKTISCSELGETATETYEIFQHSTVLKPQVVALLLNGLNDL